jgi:hypothetical protein
MSVIRAFILILICAVGTIAAVLLAPARWWTPLIANRTMNTASLTGVTGSLARGSATLRIPMAGIDTPVSWRVGFPFDAYVTLDTGEIHLRATGTYTVLAPITLALSHPMFTAPITIAANSGGTLRPTLTLKGQASAPFARVRLPQTVAQFDNVSVSLDASGKLNGRAQGDAGVELAGTLSTLVPTRGGLNILVTPQGRNPTFDAGVRATLTPGATNQYSYALTFR